MNPLETNPELFNTGSFQVKVEDHIDWINGYNNVREAFDVRGIPKPVKVRLCTLIARPIEDMNDEEMSEYRSRQDYVFGAIKRDLSGNIIGNAQKVYSDTPESFLYALSVGCLPRIFEHCFGDTVIDTRTLTNA